MPKMLIVDDEHDIREFARSFFKKRGIEVFTAAGGREALAIVDDKKPDLVLLDVRMEEMTGIEVLREIRAKDMKVKVMMVTGVDDPDIVQEANGLGVLNYVHKPLILDELEKIVMKELQ